MNNIIALAASLYIYTALIVNILENCFTYSSLRIVTSGISLVEVTNITVIPTVYRLWPHLYILSF